MSYCGTGDEIGGQDLEELREQSIVVVRLSASLAGVNQVFLIFILYRLAL